MIKWTEAFFSVQGEGKYSGQASLFLRLWGCNLECHGFGQDNPLDKDTWELDFKEYDPKANGITTVEELPVWKKGCDSSYTWAPKYNYLAQKSTVEEVAEYILSLLPNGEWGQTHMIFTGGEPMMNQESIIELLSYLTSIDKMPPAITIETNGTKPLSTNFIEYIKSNCTKLSFSVSPKLQCVTGEEKSKTLKPEVLNSYASYAELWIKPVVVDTELCWAELDDMINAYRAMSNLKETPVYVMPCGATQEEQEKDGYMASIANKALEKGYNVSVRLHVWIWKNSIGT